MAATVDPRRAEAERLYEEGVSKADIARTLGVNKNSLTRWLPSEKPRNESLRREAQALRDAGWGDAEIARRLKRPDGSPYSRQHISALLGPKETAPASAGIVTTIQLSEDSLSKVRDIAKQHGLINVVGVRPQDGSINRLLEAIARGDLILREPIARSRRDRSVSED